MLVDTLEDKRTSVDLWGGMIQSTLDYVGGEGRGDEGLGVGKLQELSQ